ncbi:MAG: PQQ-like beta-propeller repeat protein [Verrucomicrobia bacterium]|nr:PQQ-like beta-propeller repeat protein [Verrucomicrobiota bacterium]
MRLCRGVQPVMLGIVLSWFVVGVTCADDWPQWLGPQRDGVWRETGILEKFPAGGPTVRWRVPLGGGYAGPAVAGERVFVTDRVLPEGASNPVNPFARDTVAGKERVLCFNEADGKLLWTHAYECTYTISYPAGPRTTPLVADGKVYTLGAEGHLCCLDAVTGKEVWARELKKDFGIRAPVWGFAGHPLLDGRRLICLVGGDGSTVVAFDKDNGKEIWRALSAREPGYCPPMIYEAGGRRQLIVWHPESLNSLDPETGKLYWSEPFTARVGLSLAVPRKLGDLLFITAFYNGPMMMKLDAKKPAATVLWRGTSNSEKDTDKLHSLMSTPFLENGHIYGVCSYGQFRCLRADTGERVWESLVPTGAADEKNRRWANAFIVKNGDRFFLYNEKGDLIIAKLSPRGYEEISRAHLLDPTNTAAGRKIVWSHPAFANRCVFTRNDREIICVSLAK